MDLLHTQQVQTFSNAQTPVVMPLPTGPQAGGRGLGVPSQGADGNGGVKMGAVGGQGNTAFYRVQGQVILQSRQGRTPQDLGTKAVALEIAVRHVDGMGYRVESLKEVTPEASQKVANAAGQNPGGGVDLTDAVNKANSAVQATDQARKLLVY